MIDNDCPIALKQETDGSWDPSETFFFFIAGDKPDFKIADKLQHFLFLSNGILALQLATRVYDVPKENSMLLISGSQKNFENSLQETKQKVYIQMNQTILTENLPNDINIRFYNKIDEIGNILSDIISNHPKACIYAIFDDHGSTEDFGNFNYIQIYQLFRLYENRALRIFMDACNSGNFIENIETQDLLFQEISNITQETGKISIDKYLYCFKLISYFNDMNQVRRIIEIISQLKQFDVLHLIVNDIINKINIYSFDHLINRFQNNTNKSIKLRVIDEFSIKFIDALRLIQFDSIDKYLELVTVINQLSNIFSDTLTEALESLDLLALSTFLMVSSSVGEAKFASQLKFFDGISYIYPPHRDIKVLTSSSNSSLSFSYPSIRINPYTKVIAGSPTITAIFNELFFKFDDESINLESIISEITKSGDQYKEYPINKNSDNAKHQHTHVRFFPRSYQSQHTSNDSLYLLSKSNFDTKMRILHILISEIQNWIQEIHNEFNFNETPAAVLNDEYLRKVPEDVIFSAFAEYELRMYQALDATAALDYNQNLEYSDQIPPWIMFLIKSSSSFSENRRDAIAVANTAFTLINQEIDKATISSLGLDPTPLVRAATMESINPQAAAVAVFTALISRKSYENAESTDLFRRILASNNISDSIFPEMVNLESVAIQFIDEKVHEIIEMITDAKKNVINVVLTACNQNSLSNVNPKPDAALIQDPLYQEAYNYIQEMTRKIIVILMNTTINDLNIIHKIISSTDKIKTSLNFEDIVNCTLSIMSNELIDQVRILLIASKFPKEDNKNVILGEIKGLLINQFVHVATCDTVNEVISSLEKNIISNILKLINKILKFQNDTSEMARLCFDEEFGPIFTSSILGLCSDALMDKKLIETIKQMDASIDDTIAEVSFNFAVIVAMHFRRKSASFVMNQFIPRECSVIDTLIPRNEEDAIGAAMKLINDISASFGRDHHDTYSFPDYIDRNQIKSAAFNTIVHLLTATNSNSLGNLVIQIMNLINPNDIIGIEARPKFDDLRNFLGLENFELGGSDHNRERDVRLSDHIKEEKEIYDQSSGELIVDWSSDEYYSDDSEGRGFRTSGQFLDIKDNSQSCSEKEKSDGIDEKRVVEVLWKADLPKEGWENDMFWAFSYIFKERVAKLGIEFEHIKSIKLEANNTSNFMMAYRAVKVFFPFTHVPLFQQYKASYMKLFQDHMNIGSKLREAFVSSFDEADRILSPIYYRRATYQRDE